MLLLVLATAQLLMLLPCGGCGARSKPERLRVRFACVRFVLVGTLERCAAHVAALGGRRKPERLHAFCVWAFCLTPQKLQDQGAGANPNACVHFACVRFACVHLCAAKVAGSGGRRKPERLRAFFFLVCVCVCVCAFCVRAPLRRESCLRACTSAPRKLQDQGARVNRNACVHFACVRFGCVHFVLLGTCDH